MENLSISVTTVIIAVTCIVSFLAFGNEKLRDSLIMSPVDVKNNHQYYRFLSSGFIHGDFIHLLFNMMSLYIFGQQIVEPGCEQLWGKWMYPVLYFAGMVISDIPSY